MFNLKVSEKVTQRAHQGYRNFRALGRKFGAKYMFSKKSGVSTAGLDMRKACQDIKTNKYP